MSITVKSPKTKIGFIKNAISTNAVGCEEIHAAVVGKKIKIRSLTLNSDTALTITVGEGFDSTASIVNELVGPIALAANTSIQFNYNPLLELTENTSLTVDASGAGNICVLAQGIVE